MSIKSAFLEEYTVQLLVGELFGREIAMIIVQDNATLSRGTALQGHMQKERSGGGSYCRRAKLHSQTREV